MAFDYQSTVFKSSYLPASSQQAAFDAFHEKWSHHPLDVILQLRGFYIKVGQVLSGQPALLPEPYVRSLKSLQEDVPPPPFSTVAAVIASELGVSSVADVFSQFDETPIGAASIGAVHLATLRESGGNRRVAVKVQYPEAEPFFFLDFATIILFFRLVNPNLVDVVRGQQSMFANEFDYRKEGANLRLMCSAVKGRFDKLNFPAPYDDEHPNLPETFRRANKCLVTKRVLVMDLCEGKTLTKIGADLLKDLAKSQGLTVEQLTESVRRRMLDPNFVDSVADTQRRLPSDFSLASLLFVLRARDSVLNALRSSYNVLFHQLLNVVAAPLPPLAASLPLPPDGPRLMRFLNEVQGACIFELGAFNPDLHAGNVMVDSSTGVVSLLDFGQVVRLDDEYRTDFARYIIALDDRDKEAVRTYWSKLGNEFVWNETGEMNPVNETFACACFHFGGPSGMKEGMSILGFNSISEVLGTKLIDKINITKTEARYGMLQRSGICLSGVAAQVGVIGISTAKSLRPAAEKWLLAKNKVVGK